MTLRSAAFVYLALLVLLAVTIGVDFLDLGIGNTLINLGIAAAKAALVGVFFMHLRSSGFLVRMTLATITLWLAILFGMTLIDFLSR